jgi:hypothetical protein
MTHSMANQPIYTRLPNDPCLTEEQILAYLGGHLLPAAQHGVERHLLDCPFCADAVQGWQLVKNHEPVVAKYSTTGDVAQIHATKSNRRKTLIWMGSAAAIVIAALVATPLIWKADQEAKQIANKPDVPTQAEHIFPDSLVKADSVVASFSPTVPSAPDANGYVGNQTILDSLQQNYDTTKNGRADQDAESQGEIVITATNQNTIVLNDKLEDIQESNGRVSNNASWQGTDSLHFAKPAAEQSPAVTISPVVRSPELVEQKSSLDSSRKELYANDKLHRYKTESDDKTKQKEFWEQGMAYMEKKQPAAALPYFNLILANKKEPHYADSQWQKAQALLQLNRKEEAKKMLQTIVDEGGIYKDKAIEELKKL